MNPTIRLVAPALLALAAGAAPAPAVETVLLESIRDNTLYESETGGVSNGAGQHMFAGMNGLGEIRRALVLFPVSDSIPPGSTVEAAFLVLHMSRTQPGSREIGVHRVLQDWGEGTSVGGMGEGDGAVATEGDATWKHTFFATDFWTNDGGDFEPLTSHVQTVSDTGFYVFGPSPGLTADVQFWVDNPELNFGWMLRGVESGFGTAKRFDTKDNLVEGFRPVLDVRYTPPAVAVGEGDANAGLALRAPVPNPSAGGTRIAFTLPNPGPVRLAVHDLRGRRVARVAEGRFEAGEHAVTWSGRANDGARIEPGVYWLRLETRDGIVSRRAVLLSGAGSR